MKQIIDVIKPYISEWIWLPLILLSIILSGMLFFDLGSILPSESIRLLTPIQLAKLVVILSLLFLAMSFCYIFLYRTFSKKPKIGDYNPINPPGFLKHRRTGKYYCYRCLVKDHRVSELSIVLPENKLVCRCCDDSYDISTKIIPDSYFSKAWNEFVKEICSKNKDGQPNNQGDG